MRCHRNPSFKHLLLLHQPHPRRKLMNSSILVDKWTLTRMHEPVRQRILPHFCKRIETNERLQNRNVCRMTPVPRTYIHPWRRSHQSSHSFSRKPKEMPSRPESTNALTAIENTTPVKTARASSVTQPIPVPSQTQNYEKMQETKDRTKSFGGASYGSPYGSPFDGKSSSSIWMFEPLIFIA